MTATLGLVKNDSGLTRDRYHRYQWQGGPPMPSVTTILRIQEALQGSDGLVTWAAALAADYVIQKAPELDVPTVQDIRAGAILATQGPANVGTDVHEQVRRILTGEPIAPSEANVYHLAHFASFLGAEKPDVFYAEELIANLSLGYGGQFDFIGRIREQVAIVDVKTGKLKPTHRLQLAAYMAAEFIGRPGTAETLPVPEIEAGYILLLRPDGYELIDQTPTEADLEHWTFLADSHRRLKKWDRGDAA